LVHMTKPGSAEFLCIPIGQESPTSPIKSARDVSTQLLGCKQKQRRVYAYQGAF